MRALQQGPLKGWWLAAGPRYSMFRGDFDFVGGNETFFITSNQWGVGASLQRDWPVSPVASLFVSGGFDWYANAALSGHDSSYSPDGTSVSPVGDYTWQDANDAIHQPRFAPSVLIGMQRRFGR